jgi:hypothetical protein
MSQPNNEEFLRTALSLGMAFNSVLQRSQEQQREQEQKIAARKAQARAATMKQDLLARRNILANRVVMVMEKLTNESDKVMAQARLDQILHADLSKIPDYEQSIDTLYPESIIHTVVAQLRSPQSSVVAQLRSPQSSRPHSFMIPTIDIRHLFDQPQSLQHQSQRLPEVKEDEKKINISQFSELERLADDIKSGNLTCAICLEKFGKEDKDVEIRRCLHAFHKKCLTTWENTGRTNGKTCPCCRQ